MFRTCLLLVVAFVHLPYDIESLSNGDFQWLLGYRLMFAAAALRAALSYVHTELTASIDNVRRMQHLALSNTTKGEVVALYREKRLSLSELADDNRRRYGKRAFGQCEEIPFNPYDRYNAPPAFWCAFTTILLLYNTGHLALTHISDGKSLIFGAPALMLYWGLVRSVQIALD